PARTQPACRASARPSRSNVRYASAAPPAEGLDSASAPAFEPAFGAIMTPLALTPPALEPVSLDEARAFLRLDQTHEDELLTTLITAARLMIEAASGRMLIEQGWRIVLDAWPRDGAIRLPLSPVASIEGARVYDGDGLAQTV